MIAEYVADRLGLACGEESCSLYFSDGRLPGANVTHTGLNAARLDELGAREAPPLAK